jgi:hypothetical protein
MPAPEPSGYDTVERTTGRRVRQAVVGASCEERGKLLTG